MASPTLSERIETATTALETAVSEAGGASGLGEIRITRAEAAVLDLSIRLDRTYIEEESGARSFVVDESGTKKWKFADLIFNSVAEVTSFLASYDGKLSNGQTARLLGYYAKGDSPEVGFVFDNSSSKTANGGNCFGTGTGRFLATRRVDDIRNWGGKAEAAYDNLSHFVAAATEAQGQWPILVPDSELPFAIRSKYAPDYEAEEEPAFYRMFIEASHPHRGIAQRAISTKEARIAVEITGGGYAFHIASYDTTKRVTVSVKNVRIDYDVGAYEGGFAKVGFDENDIKPVGLGGDAFDPETDLSEQATPYECALRGCFLYTDEGGYAESSAPYYLTGDLSSVCFKVIGGYETVIEEIGVNGGYIPIHLDHNDNPTVQVLRSLGNPAFPILIDGTSVPGVAKQLQFEGWGINALTTNSRTHDMRAENGQYGAKAGRLSISTADTGFGSFAWSVSGAGATYVSVTGLAAGKVLSDLFRPYMVVELIATTGEQFKLVIDRDGVDDANGRLYFMRADSYCYFSGAYAGTQIYRELGKVLVPMDSQANFRDISFGLNDSDGISAITHVPGPNSIHASGLTAQLGNTDTANGVDCAAFKAGNATATNQGGVVMEGLTPEVDLSHFLVRQAGRTLSASVSPTQNRGLFHGYDREERRNRHWFFTPGEGQFGRDNDIRDLLIQKVGNRWAWDLESNQLRVILEGLEDLHDFIPFRISALIKAKSAAVTPLFLFGRYGASTTSQTIPYNRTAAWARTVDSSKWDWVEFFNASTVFNQSGHDNTINVSSVAAHCAVLEVERVPLIYYQAPADWGAGGLAHESSGNGFDLPAWFEGFIHVAVDGGATFRAFSCWEIRRIVTATNKTISYAREVFRDSDSAAVFDAQIEKITTVTSEGSHSIFVSGSSPTKNVRLWGTPTYCPCSI